MQRRFNAHIHVAGLCLVNFDLDEDRMRSLSSKRPAVAKGATAFLVNTEGMGCLHRHAARLTFTAAAATALEPGVELIASPDGEEVVSLDIAKKYVRIQWPWPQSETLGRHELRWLEDELDRPTRPLHPSEDDRLDWALQMSDIGMSWFEPDRACSIVELPAGLWCCTGAFRRRGVPGLQAPEYILKNNPFNTRVLAREFRLEAEGLRTGPIVEVFDLETGKLERKFALTPGEDDCLSMGLSNLPEKQSPPDMSHVTMYDLLQSPEKREDLIAPAPKDDLATQGQHHPCHGVLGFQTLDLSAHLKPVVGDGRCPDHLHWIGADCASDDPGEGVHVAIFDTGVGVLEGLARQHFPSGSVRWLRDKGLENPTRYDPHGHGTAMAGIVAARSRRHGNVIGDGVVGVAPGAALVSVGVATAEGALQPGALLAGVDALGEDGAPHVVLLPFDSTVWATLTMLLHANGDQKVGAEDLEGFLMSRVVDLGGMETEREDTQARGGTRGPLDEVERVLALVSEFTEVVERLEKCPFDNTLVVIPAGDGIAGGADLDRLKLPWIQTHCRRFLVAATRNYDGAKTERLPSSNYGDEVVELAAPGRAIPTLSPMAPVSVSGTSAAAAIVAGCAARVWRTAGDDAAATKRCLLSQAQHIAGLEVVNGFVMLP